MRKAHVILVLIPFVQLNTLLTYQAGLEVQTGLFLGLIWSQITAPSQFKNEQNLPKNGVYHSQVLSSTSWSKFHENPIKNTKVTDASKIA